MEHVTPTSRDVTMQVGADVAPDSNGVPSVHLQLGWAFSRSVFVLPANGALELGKMLIQLGKQAQAERDKGKLIVAPMSDNIREIIKKGPAT